MGSKTEALLRLANEGKKYSCEFKSGTRGQAAYHLVRMALEHDGSSSKVAATLLLSLERGSGFNLQNLVLFDPENRAYADLAITSCAANDFQPSEWLTEEGHDGNMLIKKVRDKWE
jgi:hypothetical protein